MGKNQSNLSSTGFDYVVAVTQDSINGALMQSLYNGTQEAILCYVYDDNNNPVPTDYAAFVKQANTDPFAVPDGTPATDARVQNLNNANFAFAIKAKLGLPPKIAPAKLPPIVALKPGQSSVTYTLMFAEFIATELLFGRKGPTWVNQSQPSGTSWTFTGTVDLDFQDAAFSSLSPDAQKRLKDLGDPGMFSVQQLSYDLNSADLEQSFQFDNVPSNSTINAFMTSDFVNTYWKSLKAKNGSGTNEVLGNGAKQLSAPAPTTLRVTDLNFFTPDRVDKSAPLTLNYLCATDKDPLPGTTKAGFSWDWIDSNEATQYDGVAALNRNTFARYLANALTGYVRSNCYRPSVRVTLTGFLHAEPKYSWSMSSGQSPGMSIPPSGSTILSYSYDSGTASDQAGLNGDIGKLEMSSSFSLSVSVEGNTMTVVQHLVIWCYARHLQTPASGNVVDKQITDAYTFGVDDKGEIVVSASSKTEDHSQTPKANGFLNFWANVDDLAHDVAQWAQRAVATNLKDVPVAAVQNFVFPGGQTFSFADVSFSQNQDLVSHITYTS